MIPLLLLLATLALVYGTHEPQPITYRKHYACDCYELFHSYAYPVTPYPTPSPTPSPTYSSDSYGDFLFPWQMAQPANLGRDP